MAMGWADGIIELIVPMKLKCNILATRHDSLMKISTQVYQAINFFVKNFESLCGYCHNESKEKGSRLMLKTWSFIAI